MSLNVTVESRPGGFSLVKLEGRLDTSTATYAESRIVPLLTPDTHVLLMDLAGLSYISSMGLRLVIRARQSIESHKGSFILTNLQPQIAKVLEIANALPDVPIFASMAEADRYLDAIQRKEIERQQKSG